MRRLWGPAQRRIRAGRFDRRFGGLGGAPIVTGKAHVQSNDNNLREILNQSILR